MPEPFAEPDLLCYVICYGGGAPAFHFHHPTINYLFWIISVLGLAPRSRSAGGIHTCPPAISYCAFLWIRAEWGARPSERELSFFFISRLFLHLDSLLHRGGAGRVDCLVCAGIFRFVSFAPLRRVGSLHAPPYLLLLSGFDALPFAPALPSPP
ncbi:hypothetical protein B0H16DRAFT_1602425 [Mycena metata]|uniref:Uncharacterized protein n=1 Tax=Mycena metata TaxID=1033252 RepID=A0AAD7HIR1_9AGAR|nr:hypothetical protein B0H16DRAFT_1602425 [Mycena metata]